MEYTKIYPNYIDERNKICKPPESGEIDLKRAEEEITYFSYHILGIKAYTFQHQIYKKSNLFKRLAICSSRQIGKSISVATIALWAAILNKFPSGIHKNTKVCIVSRSDDQAKKLMLEIKKLIVIGDNWMKNTMGEKNYISNRLDPYGANNLEVATFSNGCTIKCFPPTGAIRGETADVVIIDEAAGVDDITFQEDIEPTVSSTAGRIILTSTPKGQSGMWFDLFDPFDKLSKHEYERLWFPWTVCENKDQRKMIKEKYEQSKLNGDTRHFDQEYNALFTVDADAFFNSEKVDAGVLKDFQQQNNWKTTPCCIGLDYGMTNCHTVITISTLDTDEKVKLIYQYSYPLDSDDNMIYSDIKELMLKFKTVKIIADDCPQGNSINQRMRNQGLPIELFNFRSEQNKASQDGYNRNTGYYQFRNWLNRNRIKYPNIPELITEMKALQEIRKEINVSIKKPRSGFDDRIDSFMMSTLPFISEDSQGVESTVLDYSHPSTMERHSVREDKVWANIKAETRW